VRYPEAAADALWTKIEDVDVPYASLDTLIASKDTCREQDKADLARLKELARRKGVPPE